MARNSNVAENFNLTCDGRSNINLRSEKMPEPKFTELRVESRHWKHDSVIRDAFYFTSQWGYLRVWDIICKNHISFLQSRNRRLNTIKDKGKSMCLQIEPLLQDIQKTQTRASEDQLVDILTKLHSKFERIIEIINSEEPDYEELEQQITGHRVKIFELESNDEKNRGQVKDFLDDAKDTYGGCEDALEDRDALYLATFEKYMLLKQNIFFNKQSSLEIRLRINHRARVSMKEMAQFAMLLNWKAINLDENFQVDRDKYNKWAADLSSTSSKVFRAISEEIPRLEKQDLHTKGMDYKFHLMLLDNTPKHKMTKKVQEEKRVLREELEEVEESLVLLTKQEN